MWINGLIGPTSNLILEAHKVRIVSVGQWWDGRSYKQRRKGKLMDVVANLFTVLHGWQHSTFSGKTHLFPVVLCFTNFNLQVAAEIFMQVEQLEQKYENLVRVSLLVPANAIYCWTSNDSFTRKKGLFWKVGFCYVYQHNTN